LDIFGNETEMNRETTSLYTLPERWVSYEAAAVLDPLVEARSAAGVLNRLPYLRQWIDQVHEEQLRLEAAGTSRIEGAEFTDLEQEIALASVVPPHVDLYDVRADIDALVARAYDLTKGELRFVINDFTEKALS